MGLLNTGLNALGTYSALKSLFGGDSGGAQGKLNNFISEMRNNSVARTNLFDVTMGIPTVMGGKMTTQKLSLYAEGAQLPGMNIQTDSIKRYGVGPQESVPYSLQFNDININFIGDGKGEIYKFFYNWMHSIVKADSDMSSEKVSRTGLAPYEVEFKDRYQTTINITTYNEQGQPVLVYSLFGAFPKNVPDVSLSWNEGSQYMQFGVTFAYFQARLQTAEKDLALTKDGFGEMSLLQKGIKIGTALQTLAALKKPRNIQDAIAT